MNDEQLAQLFHETYERLAPDYSYKTREASAVPWQDVPDNNKRLMIAVAGEILARQEEEQKYVPSQLTLIVDLQKRVKVLEEWLTEDGVRRDVLPLLEKALASDLRRRGIA